ncbi:MAG: cobalt transporter [Gammaproteobacteria bacterium BRH_c0]|nr:MAG: cobalt transporter [Gammaproteobacteria bacterium BRH_c0]
MTGQNPGSSTHIHLFDQGNLAAERGTRTVVWITLVAMVVEISAGWWYNSMALLADGWHMSSHAVAIGLSTFAYAAARRYAHDPRFAFGTWKIEVLGGFASAVFLLCIAALMVVASVERLIHPGDIRYPEAMAVATLGLAVNVVCALVLSTAHSHDQDHHGDHGHQHQDLNLKSAYIHVLADAATSLLAIVALAGGWLYGWGWLDPLMGIIGSILIALWAKNLLRDTARVLLDREMDHPVVQEIREVVENGSLAADTYITDLHVWRAGRRSYYCILTLFTRDETLTPSQVRERLAEHEEIVHSTIEIQRPE